ncbi:MAG: DUF1801 domain-containing protein [Candidatus Saccharibacteria bacterium]|nr:DUF1801 domain-containing protein [Candidatus Saccharibacteria bacterium]
MAHTQSKNDVVNEYISSLDPSVKELFLSIREVVLAVSGDLEESIKWKNCLVYTTSRNLIQTVVGKGKVSLIFFDGAEISDKYQLLEGDGKKTRTMRLNSAEFNQEALKDYVKQAIVLAGGK